MKTPKSFIFSIFLLAVLLALPALAAQQKTAADFDGDNKTDLSIWRPGDGWYIVDSSNGLKVKLDRWGETGDTPVPGDYDGDGKTDIAVWRPSDGIWYVVHSSDNAKVASETWGVSTDTPVPGDYDGDGKTDLGIWRPGDGWYIVRSSDGVKIKTERWGETGDVPVQGDYDGDGKTDIAVWRPSTGIWYVARSSDGVKTASETWGLSSDIPVPGDYDGDGKTDLAVWRPSDGMWYIVYSSTGQKVALGTWGLSTDIPVPGDYDGDGKTDLAVWRPSTGIWYVIRSSDGVKTASETWGISTDTAVAAEHSTTSTDNYGPRWTGYVPDFSITESSAGFTFDFAGTCADSDGDAVTYSLGSTPSGVTCSISGTVLTCTPKSIKTDNLTFVCGSTGSSGVPKYAAVTVTSEVTPVATTLQGIVNPATGTNEFAKGVGGFTEVTVTIDNLSATGSFFDATTIAASISFLRTTNNGASLLPGESGIVPGVGFDSNPALSAANVDKAKKTITFKIYSTKAGSTDVIQIQYNRPGQTAQSSSLIFGSTFF